MRPERRAGARLERSLYSKLRKLDYWRCRRSWAQREGSGAEKAGWGRGEQDVKVRGDGSEVDGAAGPGGEAHLGESSEVQKIGLGELPVEVGQTGGS